MQTSTHTHTPLYRILADSNIFFAVDSCQPSRRRVCTVCKVFLCHYSSHRKYLHKRQNTCASFEGSRNRSLHKWNLHIYFFYKILVNNRLPGCGEICQRNPHWMGEWCNWNFSWFVANWQTRSNQFSTRRMHFARSSSVNAMSLSSTLLPNQYLCICPLFNQSEDAKTVRWSAKFNNSDSNSESFQQLKLNWT